MTADPERLLGWPVPEARQTLTRRDAALHALSVGAGQDPLDEGELRFLDERRMVAPPSLPTVLGDPGFWLGDPATGVDAARLVHGEQSPRLHAPPPVEGEVLGRTRVTRLLDRGEGRGALLFSERVVSDAAGAPLATLAQTTVLRGDGGLGRGDPRWSGEAPRAPPTPERPPERCLDLPTRPEQALLYRLQGDLNPIHLDPAAARAAGFERPILHGMCTFGVVCRALLRLACGGEAGRFGAVSMRFAAPLFPGETPRAELWEREGGAAFLARSAGRGAVVVSHGRFEAAS